MLDHVLGTHRALHAAFARVPPTTAAPAAAATWRWPEPTAEQERAYAESVARANAENARERAVVDYVDVDYEEMMRLPPACGIEQSCVNASSI